MRRSKSALIAFVSLTALTTLIAAVSPTASKGQGGGGGNAKDVNVVNTPGVSVVNTPGVNVANSPVVRAQQNGPWSVGITGTPNVLVGNTEVMPVPVRDVDRPTAEPFQQEVEVTIPEGHGGENGFITVPAGKILVIEQVSATGNAPDGQSLSFYVLSRVLPDDTRRPHRLLAVKEEDVPNSFFVASQQVRIYAEAVASVRISRVGSAGTASATFVVSGHLVNK